MIGLKVYKLAFSLAEFVFRHYYSPRRHAYPIAEVFSPHYHSPRKAAFTLAEVLITLGIIGVVAAMTLPSLNQKLDERSNITMLKKFYTEFSNATNLLISENSEPVSWGLVDNDQESSQRVLDMYKKRLNMQLICGEGDTRCFAFPVYKYDGTPKITENEYRSWALKSFILNNGTTVFFDVNTDCFSVFFDVNGFKKPNRLGIDVFAWAVNGKGKIVRYTDPSISIGNDEPDYNYAFEIMENGWVKKY